MGYRSKVQRRRIQRKWLSKHPLRGLIQGARWRAKRDGMPFDLEESFFDPVPTHCPVFGFPFNSKPREHALSLDRIDNNKGYTRDNVVIVSLLANRIKSDATIEQIKKVVKFYEELKSNEQGHVEVPIESNKECN